MKNLKIFIGGVKKFGMKYMWYSLARMLTPKFIKTRKYTKGVEYLAKNKVDHIFPA